MARKTLGICYPGGQQKDWDRVVKLAGQYKQTMSATGKQLVHRGLEHLNNPHPLFGDPEAGSSVKAIIKERKQKVSIVNNNAVEHVSGEQSGQRSSGDKLTPRNKADRSAGSTPALDKKKSPKKSNSDAGWIVLGMLGVGFFTWLASKYF